MHGAKIKIGNVVTFIFIISVCYAKTPRLSKNIHLSSYIVVTRSSGSRSRWRVLIPEIGFVLTRESLKGTTLHLRSYLHIFISNYKLRIMVFWDVTPHGLVNK